MTDIVKKLKQLVAYQIDDGQYVNSDICKNAIDEIERLRKYEALVQFIANDYHELSYDKIKWQRDDWKKQCGKLITEDWIGKNESR